MKSLKLRIENLGDGGYCHAPRTARDLPLCDIDECDGTPEYEFFPIREGKVAGNWYYICRGHLESIVGGIDG